MSTLEFHSIEKRYGKVQALSPLSLSIPAGSLCALLGPSGCGKTTTLRLLAGFESPDAGRILLDGQDITRMPPEKRPCAMVFQNYALWPHMTVFENVAYGLKFQKLSASTIRSRVLSSLERVGLADYEKRFPRQLSGGEQQRVALARSVALEPKVLLLDEPLSNLDASLRDDLRAQIRRLHDELGMTTVLVTHDQGEALSLADLVVVMKKGVVQQAAPPRDLFETPTNAFVATFLGKTNRLAGHLESGPEGSILVTGEDETRPSLHRLKKPSGLAEIPSQRVHVCSRSDRLTLLDLRLDKELVARANVLCVRFEHRFYFGTFQRTVWRVDGQVISVDLRPDDDRPFEHGSWAIHFPEEDLMVFSERGELLRG